MRKEEPDPIMDEVFSTRRKISERYGNDPSRYIAAIREKAAKAKALGMSYLEYCLSCLDSQPESAYPLPPEGTGVLVARESSKSKTQR